jgi:hypothetical protein
MRRQFAKRLPAASARSQRACFSAGCGFKLCSQTGNPARGCNKKAGVQRARREDAMEKKKKGRWGG